MADAVTTRRAFLRRLPHLLVGAAIVGTTVSLVGRGEPTDAAGCRLPQPCRGCGAFDWCDLPRAAQAHRQQAQELDRG